VRNKGNKGGQGQKAANGGQPPSPAEKCRFGDFPRVQPVRIEPSSEDNKRYANEQRDRTDQIELSFNLNWITGTAAGVSFLALLVVALSVYYNRVATNAAVSQAKTGSTTKALKTPISREMRSLMTLILRGISMAPLQIRSASPVTARAQ
jgi:hypothetical protein